MRSNRPVGWPAGERPGKRPLPEKLPPVVIDWEKQIAGWLAMLAEMYGADDEPE